MSLSALSRQWCPVCSAGELRFERTAFGFGVCGPYARDERGSLCSRINTTREKDRWAVEERVLDDCWCDKWISGGGQVDAL